MRRRSERAVRVAGADVWRGRWAAVVLEDGRFAAAVMAATFGELLAACDDTAVVGVDIPIGLPSPGEERESDRLTRRFVGPRWQSLFPTPTRELLEAPSLAEANALARARGWVGISAQAFGLRRAIAEVQPVAERDQRLYEVFPEASFVQANGGAHLPWSKTTWNGTMHRLGILATRGITVPADLGPAGVVAPADLLDAAAAAWSAWRVATSQAFSLPAGATRLGAVWV